MTSCVDDAVAPKRLEITQYLHSTVALCPLGT
jgi:hypothetical protein